MRFMRWRTTAFVLIFLLAGAAMGQSSVKGRILQAGVRCICGVDSARVQVYSRSLIIPLPMDRASNTPIVDEWIVVASTYTDQEGYYQASWQAVKEPIVMEQQAVAAVQYKIVATHGSYRSVDSLFYLNNTSAAEINLYMWAKDMFFHDTTVVRDPLKITLATDKDEYGQGEKVYIRYTVENITKATLTYTYNGCIPAFKIMRGGTTVWQDPVICLAVVGSFELLPGESMSFDAMFDSKEINGILQGHYEVWGSLSDYEETWVSIPIAFAPPANGRSWLALGYVGPLYVPLDTLVVKTKAAEPVYLGLYADSVVGTTFLYELRSSRDLTPYLRKLVKVRGILHAAPAGAMKGVLDVKAIEEVKPKEVLVQYTTSIPNPNAPVRTLTVFGSGRTTFLEDDCPLCDNVKIPQIDTVVGLVKLNDVVNLFNENRYWEMDSSYWTDGLAGGTLYLVRAPVRQQKGFGLWYFAPRCAEHCGWARTIYQRTSGSYCSDRAERWWICHGAGFFYASNPLQWGNYSICIAPGWKGESCPVSCFGAIGSHFDEPGNACRKGNHAVA